MTTRFNDSAHQSWANVLDSDNDPSLCQTNAVSLGKCAPASAPEFEAWPKEAEELRKACHLNLLLDIAEWFLVMCPTVFIGLAVAILSVNGRPTVDCLLGQWLEKVLKLGPTIFPLVFVAVATRSLKALRRYVSQRGTTLGTVELLLASRSLWGTIENEILLRHFTVAGLALLLLWSLSPVGGQASLRSIVRGRSETQKITTLRYLYTGPFATYLSLSRSSGIQSTAPIMSVLEAPRHMQTAPQDTWGNIRVPRLDLLPGFNNTSDEWLSVSQFSEVEQLSSLFGVPIIGLPLAGPQLAVKFMLNTSYMSLSCSPWESFPLRDKRLANYTGPVSGLNPLITLTSRSSKKYFRPSFFVDADMPTASWANASAVARDRTPRILFFGSIHRDTSASDYIVSATKCSVHETHVEALVTCVDGDNCRVSRMRRSYINARNQFGSPLDLFDRKFEVLLHLPRLWYSDITGPSPQERFLRDGATQLETSIKDGYVDLSEVPPSTFSSRLSLLINSVYQACLTSQRSVFYNNNPQNLLLYGYDFGKLPANGHVKQSAIDESCKLLCTRSTEATVTHSVEVFSYNGFWLAALFGSSTILLAVGIAGAVLGRRTLVPDMLGCVTSMTYNNRYFPLPARGGVLDPMRRARILRDMHVSVSDVEGGSEVGRLAFTSIADVRPLERGRKYY